MPPGRVERIAWSIDSFVPTHSSTRSAPMPPVSSCTAVTPTSPRSATMCVAPKSRASAWRCGCRDIAMIVVAPSRFAAMIAQSPTAPSPTTATESPGLTPAETAAWWPVPITSESVRSPGTWSSATGPGHDDEGAVGERNAHALALAAVGEARRAGRRRPTSRRAGTRC